MALWNLTLKRPGLCGWWTMRPRHLSIHSQIAPHAVYTQTKCCFVVYSTRFAALTIRDRRILRPTRLMLSQSMRFLISHNLVLSGRVTTIFHHLLCVLILTFSNKVKTNQHILYLLFYETALTHWGLLTHMCAVYPRHSLHGYICR